MKVSYRLARVTHEIDVTPQIVDAAEEVFRNYYMEMTYTMLGLRARRRYTGQYSDRGPNSACKILGSLL
jgi:hypothetical protein